MPGDEQLPQESLSIYNIDPQAVVDFFSYKDDLGRERLATDLAHHLLEDLLCSSYERTLVGQPWIPELEDLDIFLSLLGEGVDIGKYRWIPPYISEHSKQPIGALTGLSLLENLKTIAKTHKITPDEHIFMEAVWGSARSIRAYYSQRNGPLFSSHDYFIETINELSDFHFLQLMASIMNIQDEKLRDIYLKDPDFIHKANRVSERTKKRVMLLNIP